MAYYIINEEFLQQIESLEMLLKNNNGGAFGGMHKSKVYGSSCEFADYRDYMAGDDLTKVDWNAYSRFSKLYTKLYLDERQAHTKIYIDASRSMIYSKGEKAQRALELAATFAYLSVANMDKVSIYFIQNNRVHDVALGMVGKTSFYDKIGKINEIEFIGDSHISEALLPENVGSGDGLSIIISDFLTDSDYEMGIEKLVSKKRDVLCIQILDKDEIKPRQRGKMQLYDSENLDRMYKKNISRDVIKAYNLALEYVQNRIRGFCLARGCNYLFSATDEPLGDIFIHKLSEMEVLK